MISKDGRFIAFESLAGDLLPGASFPSGQRNVFLYDVVNDSVKLVSGTSPSVPADGATELGWGQVLSADGRYLVMTTKASSLGGLPLPAGGSHVVLYDRTLDAYTLVSGPAPSGLPNADLPSLDGAGRFIVFRRSDPASLGTTSAGFVFDRQSGIAARFSDPSVRVFDVQISANGSTIAFTSPGATPADAQVFVLDRRTGRRTLASHGALVEEPGNGVSSLAGLDGNGDLILFASSSTNLGVDLGFTSGGPRDPACCSPPHFAAFAFTVPPIAYTVSPACASTTGGRTVTIEGAHFRPGSTVTLDGIPATVTNVTSTAITVVTGARAPTSARTGNVEVRSPDGEYYALGNAFTYAVRGDANNSGALTAADGFYLNLALFLGGPQPASLCNGDANGSGATTSADAFFLNLYLFLGGAPPPP
ncbi:MAG: IPT/TIG domain-containing protein [Acidobacteria bacterium]|nr:IPT/TIG domain-containing protein [Acidobacteriota bacterium]